MKVNRKLVVLDIKWKVFFFSFGTSRHSRFWLVPMSMMYIVFADGAFYAYLNLSDGSSYMSTLSTVFLKLFKKALIPG